MYCHKRKKNVRDIDLFPISAQEIYKCFREEGLRCTFQQKDNYYGRVSEK